MTATSSRHKLKLGGLYRIDFLDHSVGFKSTVMCKVVGWVMHMDKTEVNVAYWRTECADPIDEEHNRECVNIVRSAIRRVRKIRDPQR